MNKNHLISLMSPNIACPPAFPWVGLKTMEVPNDVGNLTLLSLLGFDSSMLGKSEPKIYSQYDGGEKMVIYHDKP